jgi:polysaccharide biosynthesis protein PslH
MRILDVSPRAAYPATYGATVRTYNLLLHLSRRHDIRHFAQNRLHKVPSYPWVEVADLAPRYRVSTYSNPLAAATTEISERAWINAPILSGLALSVCRPKTLRRLIHWADVIVVEFPWQFEYCRSLRPDGRFALATHNVEVAKFRDYARASGACESSGGWLKLIEKMERRALKRADLILTVSSEDREELTRLYGLEPARMVEVPNGADVAMYFPVDVEAKLEAKRRLKLPNKPTVIFVGSNTPPNRAGLKWVSLLADGAPDFTFVVVGSVRGSSTRRGNLIRTGVVDNLGDYLKAADIAICPIRFGGGTKVKLLEYLASGLPTVAFMESLNGTGIMPNRHVLTVNPDADSLLEGLRQIRNEEEIAARIASEGRRYVVEHHNWARSAEVLEGALEELMQSRKSEAGSRRQRGSLVDSEAS